MGLADLKGTICHYLHVNPSLPPSFVRCFSPYRHLASHQYSHTFTFPLSVRTHAHTTWACLTPSVSLPMPHLSDDIRALLEHDSVIVYGSVRWMGVCQILLPSTDVCSCGKAHRQGSAWVSCEHPYIHTHSTHTRV